jgi:hypothetical protein
MMSIIIHMALTQFASGAVLSEMMSGHTRQACPPNTLETQWEYLGSGYPKYITI